MARLEMKRAAPTRVLSPTPLLTRVQSLGPNVSNTAYRTCLCLPMTLIGQVMPEQPSI